MPAGQRTRCRGALTDRQLEDPDTGERRVRLDGELAPRPRTPWS